MIPDDNWRVTNYSISNIQGQIMATGIVDFGNTIVQIPVLELPQGMYQIMINNGRQRTQLSFVKME